VPGDLLIKTEVCFWLRCSVALLALLVLALQLAVAYQILQKASKGTGSLQA